jgi:predicted nucleotidyltransferase
MHHSDVDFSGYIAERLATLPTVEAVALGGSRAAGTHRPDSDWDFAIYYRGPFDPADLRALGWPGEVSEIGGWGGGVFNGGGWLQADGRHIDVHFRDLADVEHHLAEARAGRFHIEQLLFYLAGVPTYILAAELAGNEVLTGSLPRPDYPPALREQAPPAWWGRAQLTIGYARSTYAQHGRALECAGAAARASCETAHAILAARGEWVTNEKRLLDRAGLRGVDPIVATLAPDPAALTAALDDLADTLRAAVADPSGTSPQLALLDRLGDTTGR